MSRSHLFIGAAVLVAGCGALVYSISRYSPRPAPVMNVVAPPEHTLGSARASAKIDAEFIEPIVDAVSSEPIQASLPEPTRLRRSVAQVLEAYASPAVDAYLTLMDAQGIDPIELIANDPESAQGHWEATRSLLATAEIDLEGIAILHTVRDGRQQYPTESPPFMSVRRDAGRAFLKSLDPGRLEVAELHLAGTFTGQQGGRFEGDLVVQFTFNTLDRQWVLTELRVVGAPVGVDVMLPPI